MDSQKKSLILCWVSNVWGRKAESFFDLKHCQFFQHVLGLLEHTTQDSESTPRGLVEDVRKHFEEHYGKDACIDNLLKFDVLAETDTDLDQGLDVELELAKITVFLLGLAIISPKGNQIVAAASLDLPVHMHGDVKTIVQSFVETQCTDSCCSSSIEEVLKCPSGAERSFDESFMKAFFEKPLSHSLTLKEQRLLREMSPIEAAAANDTSASANENQAKKEVPSYVTQNLFSSRDDSGSPPLRKEFSLMDPSMKSTPKYSKSSVPHSNSSKMYPADSPLPHNVSTHNVTFGISSPFRGLNLSASSTVSPLANFIQSPEIIQKVLLKKKELELSKMKRELNTQIYLCEDLQITIQENIGQMINKDGEIDKLKARIKELLSLQDARDELDEMKPKLADLEATIEKLNSKLLKFDYYNSQCQVLEKENSDQRDDIQQLHKEIKFLEGEMSEKKQLLRVKNQMEIQMKTLEAQIAELSCKKSEQEDECSVLHGKLNHVTQQFDQLQREWDELHANSNDSAQGESMGIIVELQVGELKAQVEELNALSTNLGEQLEAFKKSHEEKERVLSEANQHLADLKSSSEMTDENNQKEIYNLKEEISSLNKEKDNMTKKLSELESNFFESKHCSDESEQKCTHLEKLLEETEQIVTQKEDRISTLLTGLTEKENIVSELDKKVKLHEQEISSLENNISKKGMDFEDFNSKHIELISSMEEQLKSIANDKDTISLHLNSKCTELEEITQKLLSSEERATSQEEQIDELEIALNKVQDHVKIAEENLKLVKQELEDQTTENGLMKEQVVEKEKDLEQICEEKETQLCKIADYQSKLESAESERISLFSQVEEKSKEIESLNNLIGERDIQAKEHVNHIEEMKNDASTLQAQLEQILNDTKELTSQKLNALSDKAALESQLEEARLEIVSFKSNLDARTKEVSSLEEQKSDALAEIASLHTQVTLLTNNERDSSDNYEKVVCHLKTDLQEKSDMISNLKVQLALRNTETENLNLNIKDLEDQLLLVTSKLRQNEAEIAVQKSEKDNFLAATDEKIKSLEEENFKLNELVNAKNNELEILNSSFQKKIVAESEAQENKVQLNSIISKLEDKLKTTEENANSLSQQLIEMKDETTALVQNKDKDLSDFEQTISQLQENLNAIEKERGEVKGSLESATCEVASLQHDLQEAESRNMALEAKMLSQISENETLAGRFDVKSAELDQLRLAMEKATEELESQVASYKQEISSLTLDSENKEGEIQRLHQECEYKSIQLTEAESKVDHLMLTTSNDQKAMEEKLMEYSQQVSDVVTQMQQKEKHISDKEREVNTLTLQIDGQNKTIDELTSDVEQAKLSLSEMTSLKESTEKARDEVTEEAESRNKALEAKMLSQISENETLAERFDIKSAELDQLRLAMEKATEELESQVASYKQEISSLTLDSENKEGEIQRLHQECEYKSIQLTEAESKVDHLMLTTSNDQKALEEKLMEYSQQVSDVVTQMQQKEKHISDKEREVNILTLQIDGQNKTIDELKSDVEQAKLSLSEMTSLKESTEKARDEVTKEAESRNKALEAKMLSQISENETLAERFDVKSAELDQLRLAMEKATEELESQVASYKQEISSLTLDSENKEGEIQRLHHECEYKSIQLTEAESKVDHLMLTTSNDQKAMEEKLMEYSQQVSDVVTQMQQKEKHISDKEREVNTLTLQIDGQNKTIDELTSDVEQATLSLSEMTSLKESTEKARDEVTKELAEKEHSLSALNEEVRSQEGTRLRLVQTLEEEVNRLQQQADAMEQKDEVICKLETELSALTEVNDKLILKEQELASLAGELQSMKVSHEQEINDVREKNDSAISSIVDHIKKIFEADMKENDGGDPETLNKEETEEMNGFLQEIFEEFKIKFKGFRDHHTSEIERVRKETERFWVDKIDEMVAEVEDERNEFRIEIEMTKERTECIWSQKLLDHEEDVDELLAVKTATFEKQLEELRENLSKEWKHKMENLASESAAELKSEIERLEKEKDLLREELNSGWQSALEDLKIKFEVAKASEMKALSEQKAESFQVREDYESKLTNQRMESDKLLKAVHEENTKLLERETLHLKNTETQMKTANDYCNSLKKQLETATAALKSKDQEISNLKEVSERHHQQLFKMREANESLNSALQIEKDTKGKMKQREEGHMTKYNSSKMLLDKAQQENKGNAVEINKLKTSLAFAERKLQEYKHQLEQAGTALLGDSSHFNRIIQEHDGTLDDSFLRDGRNTPRYKLRSSTETRQSFISGQDETIISGDTVLLRRETLAPAGDRTLIRQSATPKSRLSITSTSSSQSLRSLNGLPSGALPNMNSCANEPDEQMPWDRLSELQRRNTLCLPHMKSSYPVEVQRVKKEKFTDDSLRLSIMPDKKVTEDKLRILGKRKSPEVFKQPGISSPKQRKSEVSPGGTVVYFPLAKDGPVCTSSRQSTPGKGKHRVLGSSIARRKQHTPSPRKSPRLNPKSPKVTNGINHENEPRESVAFNIGFTPDKPDGRKRMLRKKDVDINASRLNKSVAPKKGLAHNMRQMVKEVSRHTDLRMTDDCDLGLSDSNVEHSDTMSVAKKFNSVATPVSRREDPGHATGFKPIKARRISDTFNVKMSLFERCKEEGAFPNLADMQTATYFKFDDNDEGKLSTGTTEEFVKSDEPVVNEKPSNGLRKKSVNFSNDIKDNSSDLQLKTPVPGKEIAKKGKVAKIVSFFSLANPVKKQENKEAKRNKKNEKKNLSPSRSLFLQSPLACKPFDFTGPFLHAAKDFTPVASMSGKKQIKSSQKNFLSTRVGMINHSPSLGTPKKKKKFFTPNKITPGREKAYSIRDIAL